jgi:hypothetical protein
MKAKVFIPTGEIHRGDVLSPNPLLAEENGLANEITS